MIEKEKNILKKLIENSDDGWIETKKLDEILNSFYKKNHDAAMHCNSLMRRGLIEYFGDGEWKINN